MTAKLPRTLLHSRKGLPEVPRKMKDSGLQWVGKIPEEWGVDRLQWSLDEVNVKNDPIRNRFVLSLTNDRGVIPYSEKGNAGNKSKEDLSGYKLAFKDTIVANSMNVIIGSVGLSSYDGCVSPVYYVFRARKGENIRFINYIFQTQEFQRELRKYANGILEIRLRISSWAILKRPVPTPQRDEQDRIVAHLDETCRRIDALRERLKREIDRLEDYKKSAITKAVCHGLDPKAKMKDSGIPWVGKVPEGWKVNRGKYFLRLLARPTCEDDGVITCFRDGEVTLRSNRREEGFTISLKECGYQGIEPGDLVVHGMDGFAGSIGISDSRGKASPVLNVLDTDEDKKYLMYYLRSMAYRDVFTALSTGIRVRSCDLRWKKLADLVYILPPLPEQREIAAHIDAMVWRVNAIVEKRKRQLDALDKLKRTVVYDYVTGKREVPR